MSTESKRQVICYLAQSIDSTDISTWATSPEEPLDKGQLNNWQKIARKLREVSTL
ncbi:hypothetical protein ACT3UD_15675 [Glutamicibacter sp. 287]|uniref:hypothetical protein n=1 Tax=Micrococcaceae TaxID=1268 RepID=UPI001596A642|nr:MULTISPECIES: hypothetical protein [Micrococcaceae]